MKALKLSSNADEKKQLKTQCAVLMDVADRIKNAKDWTPLAKQQPENTKNAQIGQWAATVHASADDAPAYEATTSLHSSSTYSLSPTAAPTNTWSASGNSPFSSFSYNPNLYKYDFRQASISHIDLSDDQFPSLCNNDWSTHADTQRKDNSETRGGKKMNLDTTPETVRRASQPLTPPRFQALHRPTKTAVTAGSASTTPIEPRLASRSHIHRLTEPVSTRKRSRKEDIILLKASVVNGFKCPPWDKNPGAADFVPQDGQELFT